MSTTLTAAWTGADPREIILAGANTEEHTIDDAEHIALAALAAAAVAYDHASQGGTARRRSVFSLPAPDPANPGTERGGYVHFGHGAAAAFPGSGVVHLVAVDGGEATPVEAAEQWAREVLAVTRTARKGLSS